MIKPKKELSDRGIEIDLTGPEGNAFYLLAKAKRLAQQLSLDSHRILNDMKSGDYEHLLEVFEKHFGEYVTLYR